MCVIAIVAIAAQVPSSASRAFDQTNNLLRLKARWQDGKWLDVLPAAQDMARASFRAEVEAKNIKQQMLFVRPGQSAGEHDPRFIWFALAEKRWEGFISLKRDQPKRFERISDAENVWNDTLNVFRT